VSLTASVATGLATGLAMTEVKDRVARTAKVGKCIVVVVVVVVVGGVYDV
jgi:hypothetical protein